MIEVVVDIEYKPVWVMGFGRVKVGGPIGDRELYLLELSRQK